MQAGLAMVQHLRDGAGPNWIVGRPQLKINATVVRGPLNARTIIDYMSTRGSILCNHGVCDKYDKGHGNRHFYKLHLSSGLRQSFKPDCNDSVVHANELSQTTCTINVSGVIQHGFKPHKFTVCAGVIR